MTDEIPTGDKTTVPVSELEALVEEYESGRWWEKDGKDCAAELQALIDKHDPEHGGN